MNKKIITSLLICNIGFLIISLGNFYMSRVTQSPRLTEDNIGQQRNIVRKSADIEFIRDVQMKSFDYIESLQRLLQSQYALINTLVRAALIIACVNVLYLIWWWRKAKSNVNKGIETDAE